MSDGGRPGVQEWALYVVVDTSASRGRSHLEVAREVMAGGADVLQLRDKNASGRRLYEIARELRSVTRRAAVPFIVDDRLDVALAVEADGVHLGQEDLPATAARAILGRGRIVGVSVASVDEALRAEQAGADYVGLGPIFEARGTKPDTTAPLGLDVIAAVKAHCSIPVIAIGGVRPENPGSVVEVGADAIAVISAVLGAPDMRAATRTLKARVRAARGSRP
jgi:thiamine-phosphate pyrophosphorylase